MNRTRTIQRLVPAWAMIPEHLRIPRPLMRIRLRATVAFAVFTVVLIFVWRDGPGWLSPQSWLGNATRGVLVLGPLAAIFWLFWRAERRLRRSVRIRDGALCIRCGYDLFGADAEGICPECGRGYTLRELRWSWRGARFLPMPSRDEVLGEVLRDASADRCTGTERPEPRNGRP